MSGHEEYFKGIHFDRNWSEEDWERFFRAQERLLQDFRRGTGRKPSPSFTETELAFGQVLRRFGIDPDEMGWEAQAEAESLPLYIGAQNYASALQNFIGECFGPMLRRTYKCPRRRRFQVALRRLRAHAVEIPRNVAAGHALGYGPEGIKGNIARLRRALFHANAGVGLLSRMQQSLLSRGNFRALFGPTVRMRNELMDWIAFLRENSEPRGPLPL
jgi:hypothetical protein